MKKTAYFLSVCFLQISLRAWAADDAKEAAMMKAMAMDNGNISNSEKRLFAQSIESTKNSIARETLDVFYRDALDFYRQARYTQALEVLDKIYSIDPSYEDVATLRETITRLKSSHDIQSKRGILQEYMRKGNAAQQAGKNVAAIGYWKQALTVYPSYRPAQKKIQEVNHQMAQKQYEAGYLYYHHGDLDQALDSWSNTIAIDPSFKNRGLLLLMSKVRLSLQKARAGNLSALAAQQYAQKDWANALNTYEELLTLDPRNEEARRMAGKIKIQSGQAAYRSGREALSKQMYSQAIKHFQESVRMGYEVQRAQKGIQDAEGLASETRTEKLMAKAKAHAAESKPSPEEASEPEAPAPAVKPADVDEANAHYRQGMAAIRSKDYHRALEELDIAAQLNPADEHIYVARERARQEWNAMNARSSAAP